jgi:hypothetical protein
MRYCETLPLTAYLSEQQNLQLIVDRQHTSTSNTTKDVGTCTLEERPHTLLCNNGLEGLERA